MWKKSKIGLSGFLENCIKYFQDFSIKKPLKTKSPLEKIIPKLPI